MRRQGVLRRTSELCLFCRLNIAPASIINNRRTLSTNHVRRQQGAAAAAAVVQEPNDDGTPAPSTETQASTEDWDVDAKLSPDELRLREQWRISRKQREEELEELKRRSAASAAERAQQEEERKKSQQMMDEWRQEQAEKQRLHQGKSKQSEKQRPARAPTPKQEGNKEVNQQQEKKEQPKGSRRNQESRHRNEGSSSVTSSDQNRLFRRNYPREIGPYDQAKVFKRAGSSDEVNLRKYRVEVLEARNRPRGEPRDEHNRRTQQQRRGHRDNSSGHNHFPDDPFRSDRLTSYDRQPAKSVEKVAMPTFGGMTANMATDTRSAGDGWGSGPVQRARLVYNDAPIVQNDETADNDDMQPESRESSFEEDSDASAESDALQPHEPDGAYAQPGTAEHSVEGRVPSDGEAKAPPPDILSSQDNVGQISDDGRVSRSVQKAHLTNNDVSSAPEVDREIADVLDTSREHAHDAQAAEATSKPASNSSVTPHMDITQPAEDQSESLNPASQEPTVPDLRPEVADHAQVKPDDAGPHVLLEAKPFVTPPMQSTAQSGDSAQSNNEAVHQQRAKPPDLEPRVDDIPEPVDPQQLDEPMASMPQQQSPGADPFESFRSRWPTLTPQQRLAIADIILFGGPQPVAAQQVSSHERPAQHQPRNPIYKEAWQRQQQQKQQQPPPPPVPAEQRESARRPAATDTWDEASPTGQNGAAWGLDQRDPSPPSSITQQSKAQQDRTAQETQPSYQDDMSQPGESGYYATMFDPKEAYQQRRSSAANDVSADWQHLRRQRSQPPPSQHQELVAPPSQPIESAPEEQFSSDMVDRMFQKHKESRAPPPQPASPVHLRPNYDNPFAAPHVPQRFFPPSAIRARAKEDIVCGRCRQKGHHARDCTGPVAKQQESRFQGQGFRRQQPEQHQSQPLRSSDERQRQATNNRYDNLFQPREATNAMRNPNPFDPEASHSQVRQRLANPFASTSSEGEGLQHFSKAADKVEQRANFAPMHDMLSDRPARRRKSGDEEDTHRDFDRPARKGRFRAAVQEDDDAMSDIANRVLRRQSKFADDDDEVEERGGRSRDQGRKSRGRQRDDDDEDDDAAAAREERNIRKRERQAREREARESKAAEKKAKQEEERHQLKLPDFINVATLAQTLGVRYETFVRRLERLGYNDIFPGKVLNSETSGMIAMEYDYDPVFEPANEANERDLKAKPEPEDKQSLPVRPPVVTIMGHVDHGKTTILDYLRKSSVAAGEAGGITQHIGAFSVPLSSSGKTITFLDTPGHAAFLTMRQRGANVTDIVVLVVAADDSVKPQTLEALKHAQAAKVPIIVAVNKIDKPEADLQRVKQDLARHGVEIEDFGGDVQVVPVSGKTGEGMDALEENVVTLSEILDHRAETDGPVEGWVLEATTKNYGRVATVLVRRGTLKTGSVIVAGRSWARVRSLRNEAGQSVEQAGPGTPVEVDGWRDQPVAGDEVLEAPSEQKATDVVEYRLEKVEREKTAVDMEAINDARKAEQEKREKERAARRASKYAAYSDFFEAAANPGDDEPIHKQEEQSVGPKSVPFIIKADVSGSAEAVSAYIMSISSPLIMPRILKSEVGSINPSDVELAAAAQGHIVAFSLPSDEIIKGTAEARGVKVLENDVIYRVLDDVKAVLEEMLPPIVSQRVLGEAEIAQAFEIGIGGRKKMKIAGCKVRNGVVAKNHRVRVMRGSERIYDGTLSSLKNVKKDVQEMRKGTECGMGFDAWEQFEVGDQIQTYEEVSEKRKL